MGHDYITFGKSGHRAWHRSLTFAARLRGQSAVSLSSHSMIVPSPPFERDFNRGNGPKPAGESVG